MNNDYRVLDVNDNISFKTIYEAINWCAGTNYIGWMKACWPSVKPEDGFRLWFPKLSPVRNGEYVSVAFDCINYLSDDWNYLCFDDLKGRHTSMDPLDHYCGEDLIFAKDVDGDYIFRGVFVRDAEKSSPNHCVSRRIATKAKLIGSPARQLELLDAVESKSTNDINTPMRPQNISYDRDNTIRYVCGRCGCLFKANGRCPECGQLIQEID